MDTKTNCVVDADEDHPRAVADDAQPQLPCTTTGRVEISRFVQHEANPNEYTEEAQLKLNRDVLTNGGPCTQVVVTPRPDGTFVVLSGWHNILACLANGWTEIDTTQVKVMEHSSPMEEDRLLHCRNKTGKLNPLKVAALMARFSQRDGMSVREIAAYLGEDETTVQRSLARHKLAESVFGEYKDLVGAIQAEKSVAIVRRGESQEGATMLLRGCCEPARLLGSLMADTTTIDAATTRWGKGGLSGPEIDAFLGAVPCPTTSEAVVSALFRVMAVPARKAGRPKGPRAAATRPESGAEIPESGMSTRTGHQPDGTAQVEARGSSTPTLTLAVLPLADGCCEPTQPANQSTTPQDIKEVLRQISHWVEILESKLPADADGLARDWVSKRVSKLAKRLSGLATSTRRYNPNGTGRPEIMDIIDEARHG